MANYNATVSSSRPADEVYAYLADFRTVAEWDPSITESTHVNADDPIKVGAMFKVVTSTLGTETTLEYTTTELERPARIVLRGENESAVSIDTITITSRQDGGCDVNYDADITLKGAKKIAEPAVKLGMKRLGDKAKSGLEEKLNPS